MHIAILKLNMQMLSLASEERAGLKRILSAGSQVSYESLAFVGPQQDEINQTVVRFGLRRQTKVRTDELRVHRLQQNVLSAQIAPIEYDLQVSSGIGDGKLGHLFEESIRLSYGIGSC